MSVTRQLLKVGWYIRGLIVHQQRYRPCDSASNAPKWPLNNDLSIVKKIVVKLSNTSTMLFPPVAQNGFQFSYIMTYIHPLINSPG